MGTANNLSGLDKIFKEFYSDSITELLKPRYKSKRKNKRNQLIFNDPLLPFFEDELVIMTYDK